MTLGKSLYNYVQYKSNPIEPVLILVKSEAMGSYEADLLKQFRGSGERGTIIK